MKSGHLASRQIPPGADAVLLVDDEPQALKWFSRRYGDEFRVLTAGGVAQALELLDRHAHEVAVLLTDYRMPVQDGVTLLSAARERFSHVSRLMMSAYADKDVAMAAVNQGQVDHILEKPLDEARTREVLRAARDACQRRLREQALLQRRDDTLRDTLGFLAHEVGTPLATVSGYLSALRERQQNPVCGNTAYACVSQRQPGEVLAMLEAAQRRTDYTQSLVATFVRTARDAYHADGAASERASDLVRSVCQDYPLDGEESGWLTFDLRHDFMLPGQRDLLYLVLCTLVKNAVLALRAHRPDEPAICIVLDRSAEGALIRVSDNGPGIAPELLSRLTLEPVTTRSASGGHGMGLVFCQRVMVSLGGSIEIRSQQGHGASVDLHFNFRDEEQAHEVCQ